jgi:GDP/UDP-N,N'-diacetylbacillosamine 2-epimerase (hydrolysing)
MKLLFFTGSRGEWGYLRPLLEKCKEMKIKFHLCATNMHLLENFGLSINEIKKDGFKIDDKIYMALDGYNKHTVAKSMGILMSSFVDTIYRLNPDWLVIAGDRSETLIAAIAAAYTDVPIAHIQAGELSGNIDGQARHAIGKFSNLHFASNKDAATRLKKLGEEKFRIKLVGAPQLDDLRNNKFNLTSNLSKKYNIDFSSGYILVIYHPPQAQVESIKKDLNIIFKFLKKTKMKKIWISPNNDAGSSIIKSEFLKERQANDYLFDNLPRIEYLTLLKNTNCIFGNSSSGILESPSFRTPCINIGYRQFGRFKAKNIIDVKNITLSRLKKAFKISQSNQFKKKIKDLKNPYGDGNSSEKILNIILNTKIDDKLMFKKLTY